MNKFLKNINIMLLVLVSGAMAFSSTLAWFKNGVDISMGDDGDINLVGGVELAYFGGGTGTVDDPYIISNRNHLYNLAWLQYLGKYNTTDYTAANPTSSIQQKYFKITSDIDMEGIVLPPIGTETYPFYGHIDAGIYTKNESTGEMELTGSYKIKNLVVSNDDPRPASSDFGVNKPSKLENFGHAFKLNGNAQLTRVVGFIGVAGSIPTNTAVTSSLVPSIENVELFNIKVQSGSHSNAPNQLLIGLAAGYMKGSLSGIKVSGSSSIVVDGETALDGTNISTKLSDYGLVGYTPSSYLGTGSDTTHKVSEYYDSTLVPTGNDNLWGGSLDMQSLYTRLKGVEGNQNDAAKHTVLTTLKCVDKNGNGSFNDSGEQTVVDESREGYPYQEEFVRRSYNSGTDFRGNYNFVPAESSPERKIYMVGGTYQTKENFNTSQGRNITDGNGHYLTNKCASKTNGDDADTKWIFDNGKIYSYDYPNREYVYLVAYSAANNMERITTTNKSSEATTFTINETNGQLIISHSSNYRLAYSTTNNFGWAFYKTSNTTYNQVTFRTINANSGTNYIPATAFNGNRIQNVTGTTTGAVIFNTYSSGQKASFRLLNGNDTYYLYAVYTSDGGTYSIYATTDEAAANMYYYENSGSYYIRSKTNDLNSRYAYLYYSNNGWACGNTTTQWSTTYAIRVATVNVASNLTFNANNSTLYNSSQTAGPDISTGSGSSGKMAFTADDTSYFPIKASTADGGEDEVVGQNDQGVDITKHRNQYEALGNNCGYFVGGMTGYAYRSLTSSQKSLAGLRSITMADMSRSTVMSSSLTNNELDYTKIKTIKKGTNGNVVADIVRTDYEKFGGSYARMKDVVAAGEGRVYGLHFLNYGGFGLVSMDNIVRARNIRLEETNQTTGEKVIAEYPEYDLPVYSVNFNLQEQGYINFFGGNFDSSGSATEGFFSLYKIIRSSTDKTTITGIKQIAGVYKPTGWKKGDPYVYSYKAANGSIVDENGSAFNTSEKTLAFDTSWIGNNKTIMSASSATKRVYYFEVPVDAGEYAMGAVDGVSKNGYLMYLDIGANGKAIKDEIYSYSIVTSNKDMLYPLGVDFAVENATGVGGDSLCVLLSSQSDGIVTFIVSDSTISIDGTTETISGTKYSICEEVYQNKIITVNGASGGAPPKENTAPTIRTRTTYITVVVTNQSDITQKTTYYFKLVNNVNEAGVVIDANNNPVYDAEGNNVSSTKPYQGDTLYYVGTKSGSTYTWTPIGYETTTTGLISRVPSLADEGILDILRTSDILITLTKVSTKGSFDISLADMPWTAVTPQNNDPYFVYTITVTANKGTQYTITYVTGTHITVDGTTPASGSTVTKP